MKFLVDVCLSREVAQAVAVDQGVCYHWLDIGQDNARDMEIIQWCTANDHVLITADQDFGAILKHSGSRGPSVILLRTADHAPSNVTPLILGVIQRFNNELRDGYLIALDERSARLRRLPIE
jgi:predicted nuclease of predicted toxin-antitoxin system